MTDDNTIFAVASGAGKAGVAVIRLSGPRCAVTLEALTGPLPEPRRASLRTLRGSRDGQVLEQGLVLWFPAPGSFTGEDMAELHVHGGRASISDILETLGARAGLRAAAPGEFTRRAFHNGKLDLTQVEALADLIDADTRAQKSLALSTLSGAGGTRYEGWRNELVRCLAYFEAEIDFPDEEAVPGDLAHALRGRICALKEDLEAELVAPRAAEMLREGFRVVIAGAPNVGKSSLMNALAQRDVAIVSEQAGTTRDILEVRLDLRGFPVILADMAGLRDARDAIERQGVDRARRRVAEADLVLLVGDASDGSIVAVDGEARERSITVWNKADIASLSQNFSGQIIGDLMVSALTGAGLDGLVEALANRAQALLSGAESAVITRQRHRTAIVACTECLTRCLLVIDSDVELAAEDLRLAARHIGSVTGRVDVEDLLDVIFADFCVGK